MNPALAGRVFPSSSYLVGREKIREFALAVRSSNPLHHDVGVAREAGFVDVIAPTTFTTVVQQRAIMHCCARRILGSIRLVWSILPRRSSISVR
ncbi:hypothetical protein N806_03570 [Rhodococcus sp. P27]|nr:hypothetical protein N806_03570 [Rhodococcus sp. P27]